MRKILELSAKKIDKYNGYDECCISLSEFEAEIMVSCVYVS
jgi:hypothetical protein